MFSCKYCPKTFNKKHYFEAHLNLHKEQNEFLKKFMSNSLNDVEYVNGVPKVVFTCWFGGYGIDCPQMSQARFECFKDLVKNIHIPVILLTSHNYKNFVLDDHPIHPAFEYLSGVHKSDYFRCYMLNHYGGGYHDIKSRLVGWDDEFEKNNWTLDKNIWMYGRQEKNELSIGHPPNMEHFQKEYKKMVTMGWIICKKETPCTIELLNQIHCALDNHYDDLVKHPGIISAGYYSDKPREIVPPNSYPVRWLEILGEIFHPLMLKYTNNIKFGLSDAIKTKRYK